MDNNKKILIKKNQNQSQYQTVPQTQENILKQNELNNPNLSESGATTTSSVSSNTKNNHVYGNYKTPKKKNFQIPVKKNVKTVSPDFPNKSNKIYSKGIVKRFPSKKEQNQINNVKNSNINNAVNNHVIKNTTINNNSKQYNRSLSQISIEQM